MSTNMQAFDAAVRRLLEFAHGPGSQSDRVSDFLLSWWNGEENGKICPSDLWNLDSAITEDILLVLSVILRKPAFPDSLGYTGEFQKLWATRHRDPAPLESPFGRNRESLFKDGSGGALLRSIVMSLFDGKRFPAPLEQLTSLDQTNFAWLLEALECFYRRGDTDNDFLKLAQEIYRRDLVAPRASPAP